MLAMAQILLLGFGKCKNVQKISKCDPRFVAFADIQNLEPSLCHKLVFLFCLKAKSRFWFESGIELK